VETIYIRAIGDVDMKIIQYLTDNLSRLFNRAVQRLEPITVPPASYDPDRKQNLSTEILKELLHTAATDNNKILGLTKVDLFIPIFTYVFGEAQLGGRVALMSLSRLRPEYPDEELYKLRILKEAAHELGHTFGLTHCPEPACVMTFANNVIEVDSKGDNFCPSCAERII
jgi:archaemetzincin